MDKTVKVQIEHKTFNRLINKEIMKRKNYLVHDEGNIAREGDVVRIEACRPLSARKHFAIAEIRKNKGSQFAKYDEMAKQQVLLEENEKTREFISRRERTDNMIKEKSSLVSDLSLVAKGVYSANGALTEEENQKIAEIKEKYQINSWPPNKDILALEIQSLRSEIQTLQDTIEFVDPVLNTLMSEQYQSRVDDVLRDFAKKDPAELKKNIKKNILRKYLLTNPTAAKEQFRDVLDSINKQ